MLSIARLGAWQSTGHSLAAWIFVFFLLVVFPVADYFFYFRLKSTLQLYVWNIFAEWGLVAGGVWVARQNGLSLTDLGQSPGSYLRLLLALGLLLAVVGVVMMLSRRRTHKARADQLSKAAGQVRRLLPVSQIERRVWVAVALTAGICEELIYRGWLLSFTGAATRSLLVGLVVSSIFFGLAHAYQGRNGIIGASVLGMVFGTVFVVSGTVIPGQILHVFIDLNNGLVLGKKVSDGL